MRAQFKQKAASHAILALLLIETLTTTSSFQLVRAERTITVKSDGSVEPTTAPIQRNGHIYTLTSNLREPIVIERNNMVLDGKGYFIQGNGTGQGITLYNVENVTIKNTLITEFSRGIHMHHAPESTITRNTITNSTYIGILMDQSPETTLTNNIIDTNKWDGIFITASPNSQILNNTVANHSKWGIYLGYSPEGTLKNNTMTNNRYNFAVTVDFLHDIDDSNTVDGKRVYYWINQQNRRIPSDAGYVALIGSVNIEAHNLELSKNGQGIVLVNSAKVLIEDSRITSHGYYGVYLIESHYNTIRNNTITNNHLGGIAALASTGNVVANNTLNDNNPGIYLLESNTNHIYQNNFINNTRQAVNQDSTNVWDHGRPLSGNYWSDYTGVDIDQDGTGDTPYRIDNENQDKYPLVRVVQKVWVPSSRIYMELILLIIGIAATVAVGSFAYFGRKRRNAPVIIAR